VTAAQGEGDNASDLVLTLANGSRIVIDEGLAGTIGSYGTGTALRFGAGIARSDIHLRLDGGDLVIGIGKSQSLRYGDKDGCDEDGWASCLGADLKKRRQPPTQRPIHIH